MTSKSVVIITVLHKLTVLWGAPEGFTVIPKDTPWQYSTCTAQRKIARILLLDGSFLVFLFFTLAYDTPLTRMFNLYTRRIRPYAATVPPPFDARSRISTAFSTLFFVGRYTHTIL